MKAVTRPLAAAVLLGLAVAGFVPVSAAAQDDPVLYVVANVVKLRAAPLPNAEVLAYLRVNSPVRVVADETVPGDWTKVNTWSEPGIEGYVASDSLSEKRQSADAVTARYDAHVAAGDPDAALKQAESMVALEPGDRGHVERLLALYDRLGDEARAFQLMTYLQGDGAKYLVYCTSDSKMVLLAEYRPRGGLASWVGWPNIQGPYGDRSPEELSQLVLALQRSPWFGLRQRDRDAGGSVFDLPGSSFLNARLAPAAGRDGPGYREAQIIQDGDCIQGGQVYSNEPLQVVDGGDVDWTMTNDYIGIVTAQMEYTVEGVRARGIDGGLVSVVIDIERENVRSIEPQDFIWGLIDSRNNQRLATVGIYQAEDRFLLARRVAWFKWEMSPERVAIVEYFYQTNGSVSGDRIDIFVVDEHNRITHLDISLTFQDTG